jgi:ornithine cyclodeaminase
MTTNSQPLILDETTLRHHARLDLEALEVVEQAFTWLAEGRVDMPPIQHITVSEGPGDVDIKSAYVRGLDHFAIKIASGFFQNAQHGLPTGSGLMVVLSAKTGFCRAVLLDNGYLTDLRTALAGAVAARHLAPSTVETAGIVGTGRQAELQARALHLVRPFERLLIHGRTPKKAEALARRLGDTLGVQARAEPSLQELARHSQCVVTTTPSTAPLLTPDMLHPGLHITAMGSDIPGKQELHPDILRTAHRVVVDRRSQSERLGELQHLPDAERARLPLHELGELTSGRVPGRENDQHITVCDLTGTGVQDTAIATYALDVAQRAVS